MSERQKCSSARISNPCDTCVVRRVKCGIQRPCDECRKRGLECTSLKTRKKRGPKGPRESTSERVRQQQRLDKAAAAAASASASSSLSVTASLSPEEVIIDDYAPTSNKRAKVTLAPDSSVSFPSSATQAACNQCEIGQLRQVPLASYYKFIDVFRERLYPIWPVVSLDRLLANITYNEKDYESYALAAALCAATISQLRLQEHFGGNHPVSSRMFARDAERYKSMYDYRENCGLPSLLTAFFLHMYYSNANKLRTAALLLREAITCAHTLELHRSDTITTLGSAEQSLRVRVYWLLFISEMTFAAQNGLPTILHPIDAMPHDEEDSNGADLRAFMSLTHLFSFLRTPGKSSSNGGKDLEGVELAAIQQKLSHDGDDSALNDTQRVDLCVTRQWIRVLTWEYMTRHFPMSRYSEDPAFSLLLPVNIGREMLLFFSSVESEPICAHGYGMELKVFRMADTIADIMMCSPGLANSDGMVLGGGDVLLSLQKVIEMVGGQHSEFFGKLQRRLGTLKMNSLAPARNLSVEEGDQGARHEVVEEACGQLELETSWEWPVSNISFSEEYDES